MWHLAFFWETVQILCASCCCTQSDPPLVRVGRPWLSTATQCYLPIILGMDTDNLCELYRRSTRSTEFDGAHKDIRGPDLPASPWRAIQIWSHYYAQFRTIQSAAAQTTTVLAKEIWPVQQSHSVCHCKAFALDILCLLRSDGQLDMLTWKKKDSWKKKYPFAVRKLMSYQEWETMQLSFIFLSFIFQWKHECNQWSTETPPNASSYTGQSC